MVIETFTGGQFLQNGYFALCEDTGQSVIIDPGAGTDRMLAELTDRRSTVVAVVLTHGHFDHIEGLNQVRDFTDAPVYMHPLDGDIFEQFPAQAAQFGVEGKSLKPPDINLSDGDAIEFGNFSLDVLHTPGHSPGHVILVDKSKRVAFVGDLIFKGSVGRTDLPGGDPRTLFRSIKKHILPMSDEYRLFSGHGPSSTVRYELETNPFLTERFMSNDL